MFLPRLDFNPRFDYFSYNFVLKLKKKLCFQTISRFLTVETNIQTTSSCLVPTENQEMLVNFDIIFLKRKHFGLQVHACWRKTTLLSFIQAANTPKRWCIIPPFQTLPIQHMLSWPLFLFCCSKMKTNIPPFILLY